MFGQYNISNMLFEALMDRGFILPYSSNMFLGQQHGGHPVSFRGLSDLYLTFFWLMSIGPGIRIFPRVTLNTVLYRSFPSAAHTIIRLVLY